MRPESGPVEAVVAVVAVAVGAAAVALASWEAKAVVAAGAAPARRAPPIICCSSATRATTASTLMRRPDPRRCTPSAISSSALCARRAHSALWSARWRSSSLSMTCAVASGGLQRDAAGVHLGVLPVEVEGGLAADRARSAR